MCRYWQKVSYQQTQLNKHLAQHDKGKVTLRAAAHMYFTIEDISSIPWVLKSTNVRVVRTRTCTGKFSVYV